MDSTKHCILGTQQFRPRELASQMNLSMDNGWGIIRCIVDYCMGLEDGKYLILKDPNKVLKETLLKGSDLVVLGLKILKDIIVISNCAKLHPKIC